MECSDELKRIVIIPVLPLVHEHGHSLSISFFQVFLNVFSQSFIIFCVQNLIYIDRYLETLLAFVGIIIGVLFLKIKIS